jgi:dethiobiotin synthetase
LRYDAVVVEGIGGLLVPIQEGYFVLDLARDTGLPLVVTASPFLGTLNHTLLTVERALDAGLQVAGVILCYHRPPEGTLAERTNPGVLGRLLPVPLLGTLPHLDELSPDALAAAAEEHLKLDVLFSFPA